MTAESSFVATLQFEILLDFSDQFATIIVYKSLLLSMGLDLFAQQKRSHSIGHGAR